MRVQRGRGKNNDSKHEDNENALLKIAWRLQVPVPVVKKTRFIYRFIDENTRDGFEIEKDKHLYCRRTESSSCSKRFCRFRLNLSIRGRSVGKFILALSDCNGLSCPTPPLTI